MQKSPFHLSQLVPFLPYLYFIGLSLYNFMTQASKNTASPDDLKLLILAIPFTAQLIFSFKHVDLILGALTFMLSVYLGLAYLTDVVKITTHTTQSINFIILGGILVVLNFIMSILLFRNEMLRIKLAKVEQRTY